MEGIPFGAYIRQLRKDQKMSQEDLCDGICNPVTLSRIENGRQTAAWWRMAAMLERLGAPGDRCLILATPRELEIERLKEEIIDCNVRLDKAEGLERLRKLEQLASEDGEDRRAKQILLRSKAILGTEDGPYSPEERLTMLLEAIRQTVPRFQVDQIGDFFYSLDEVKILNQIANAYADLGQHAQALNIFRQLLSYIQSHFQNVRQSAAHLPLVAFNYALELSLCGRYGEAVEVAELGRETSVRYGHYQFLPGLHHILAECAHYLGDEERSRDYYRRAYYLYLALDDVKNIARVKQEARQYFGPEFCL